MLDDGEYLLPFRIDFGTAADILQSQVEDSDDIFVDYRPQFLELTPSDALQKYRLLPKLRGTNDITGTKIIDRVQIRDRGSDERFTEFQVDELAEAHFKEQLLTVDGIDTEETAQQWIDEYTNLRTASWALTSDTEFVETELGMDAQALFKAFGDAGIYRNEQSPEAGVLHFPERRADELEESKQEKYFGEILEPQGDEEENPEDDSEQVTFGDFS